MSDTGTQSPTGTVPDPSTEPASPAPRPPKLANAPFRDADADVVLRSCDRTDFRVHRLILCKSSQVFSDMFSIPQPPQSDAGEPVVEMAETRHALRILLGFCYSPAGFPLPRAFEDIKVALDLVRKYQMDGLVPVMKHLLQTLIAEQPIRVFAVAWSYQWKDVALAAARCLDLDTLVLGHPFIPEFKEVSAEAVWRLQQYQDARKAAIERLASHWKEWVEPAQMLFPITGEANRCDCVRFQRGTRLTRWATTMTGWWTEHMSGLHDALKEDHRPETVASFEFIMRTLAKAHACVACREKAAAAMDAFNIYFKKKMESTVSELGLETPF
ncbi:hypothetical protein DENSPDRAFT_928684 [Dentipellis sp. KUC8613]|nr:hypothetical protein DENSPDRAFT_928684 [Dentipellis sp. KUC8613]